MNALDTGMTDEAIIELFWQRDERAISVTDAKYRAYLFTIAQNIIYDTYDCDECLSDTYLRTWNKISPTRPRIFSAFLAKITRGLALDKFRRNTAEKRIPSELVVSLSELDECITARETAEERLEAAELAGILNCFIDSLTPSDEYIFICRYYYADKISLIARGLGLSENTILRRLSRMRASLKLTLEREGFNV
ncbi:MAG: sigma-70 family RNA polymerase sigma factor [Clostridia bacterium]|nr:sigma-70 family RNA polymerase sigma factor [Clostridia bacterium]